MWGRGPTNRRFTWGALVLLLVPVGLLLGTGPLGTGSLGASPTVLHGLVVGPTGTPIAGVRVDGGGHHDLTDRSGRFSLSGDAGWLSVTAPGWVPRVHIAEAGRAALVRLVPDAPGTVTLAFGGDVMFGRRFFDPAEDGSMTGLLGLSSSPQQHAALLAGVAPLLASADVTVVNLESPLTRDPYFDPLGPRPRPFHPAKEYVFAAEPAAAAALAEAGVDVVGLANNHLFDRLRAGVLSTRRSLAEAGFRAGSGFFGAGRTIDQAWAPAYVDRGGQRVAVLGCTTIRGEQTPPLYTATTTKAGAAPCRTTRLTHDVRRATRHAQVVVVVLHGGFEYARDPSTRVRQMADAAVAAGADLVIGGHPHVVGGLRADGAQVTAWSMGNLLFDQTLWPTFDSMLLQVVLRDGRIVGAWTEPLRIDGFLPTGVWGADADWVSRGMLARSQGPWVLDDGALWLDLAGAAARTTGATTTGLSRIERGCAPGAARDLLWTGDFEDRQLATGTPAPLWNVVRNDPYRVVLADAAHGAGHGVLLHRASAHTQDVLLAPSHRVLVDAGDRLTLLVDHRALHGTPDATWQLSWYADTRGPSQAQTLVRLPVNGDWRTSRLEVVVPHNAVAVLPIVRLAPPATGVSQLAVDNVRLVDWSEQGCDYAEAGRPVTDAALAPLAPAPALTPVLSQLLPATVPVSITPAAR